MGVHWYPGHMARAKRILEEQLKFVDVIVEVLDARIPASSRNPDLDKMIKGRPRILVLNKADLAEKEETRAWLYHFRSGERDAVAIDSIRREGANVLTRHLFRLADDKRAGTSGRFLLFRPVRVMVVGIPNVGKSSLINCLVRRAKTKTAAQPGVTRGPQWVRIQKDLELLDTPGLLWPKLTSPETGFHLAITGAVSERVYDWVEIAVYLIRYFKEFQDGELERQYELGSPVKQEHELLEELANRWGFLQTGGIPDREKAAFRLLQEFRVGKLGRITLEKAPSSPTIERA
ncbi:MAG TPA: ribosome biogenesis GTPase YlqF [Clostridia bacterium]|nr:ribosome biogenesis GTPase YlqF [Clostridia bacterium]